MIGSAFAPFLAILRWLGRLGTWAVAASLVAGLALPQFAVLARPTLPFVVFVLLTIAFIRLPREDIRRVIGRPGTVLAGYAWIALAVPGLVGALLVVTGVMALAPGTGLGIFLMVVAPPVVSSPAFAELMGLEGTYSLAILVLAMITTPVLAPLFVASLPGSGIDLDGVALGVRLGLLIGGAGIVAAIFRRIIGFSSISRQGSVLDGINVLMLFVFVIALMGDTTYLFLADPLRISGVILLTFLVAGAIAGGTYLVLARMGRIRALTTAMAASSRNMGLMAAVAGTSLPKDTWLWFALAQFPIYLLPLFFKPVAKRVVDSEAKRRPSIQTGNP